MGSMSQNETAICTGARQNPLTEPAGFGYTEEKTGSYIRAVEKGYA